MRRILMRTTLALTLFVGSLSFAGETYESEQARFRVTFPGEYEVETETEDGTTTISLSCVYGNAIILGNAYIYEEDIPEEDNDLSEAEATLRVCNAFGTKWKGKKLFVWQVGDDHGFGHPLQTKLDGTKYYGNYYVYIKGNIQYQFTYFANTKKYDTSVESRFINSFSVLD